LRYTATILLGGESPVALRRHLPWAAHTGRWPQQRPQWGQHINCPTIGLHGNEAADIAPEHWVPQPVVRATRSVPAGLAIWDALGVGRD
jgi:hypothetical protein